MVDPITSIDGVFIWMLMNHAICEFVFQEDHDALNKRRNNKRLLVHVVNYTSWLWINIFVFADWWLVMAFAGITFVFHFATDYCTSRISYYYFKRKNIRAERAMFGLDQALHYAQLWFTYKVLLLVQDVYI